MRIKKDFPYRDLAELSQMSFVWPLTSEFRSEIWHEPYPNVSYETNTHGFRAAEFTDAETVVLGCSTTFGVGLPFERTWPIKLKEHLGATNIVAIPGGSIPQIVDVGTRIMSGFRAPKRVMFLTPNLERLHVSFSLNIDAKATFNWDNNINEFISMRSEKIEVLKIKSHDGKFRSVPLELAISESYKSLIRLGNLCKLMGADFHYFSWIDDVNHKLGASGIPGFVNGESVEPSGPCHESRRGDEFWDKSIDYSGHPGEHHHEHYSKRFEIVLGSR